MAWSLACAATISRWTPASTSFASARLRPKSAMSTRPSGRLISTTSAHDPSPSAPISTSLKTQATYPPSVRERVRKYPTAVAPPISRRSLHGYSKHLKLHAISKIGVRLTPLKLLDFRHIHAPTPVGVINFFGLASSRATAHAHGTHTSGSFRFDATDAVRQLGISGNAQPILVFEPTSGLTST